jgi:hypothetical protein
MVRFSTPSPTYDNKDEAAFRRMVAESINRNDFPEINIAGGTLYGDAGNLKFRSANGTVTTVAVL